MDDVNQCCYAKKKRTKGGWREKRRCGVDGGVCCCCGCCGHDRERRATPAGRSFSCLSMPSRLGDHLKGEGGGVEDVCERGVLSGYCNRLEGRGCS